MTFNFRIAACALAIFALSLTTAGAEKFEYKEYTVLKGDTLWDITKRELSDAFQWPIVWKENQRINNPDKIYPGQVIMIPVRVIPDEMGELPPVEETTEQISWAQGQTAEVAVAAEIKNTPAPAVEKPKPKEPEFKSVGVSKGRYIITREALLESGYIDKIIPNDGEIEGSAEEHRMIFAGFDSIYIKTKKDVEPGAKYYVVRSDGKVHHPVTDEFMGYLIRIVGIVEVEEKGVSGLKTKVIEAYEQLGKGDLLAEYYTVDVPFEAGPARKPDVGSIVVASKMMKVINGNFDIVFIDKGSKDGLIEGDVLMSFIVGTNDRRNAVIRLVNVREKTSLAIVLESVNDVKRGDIVGGIK